MQYGYYALFVIFHNLLLCNDINKYIYIYPSHLLNYVNGPKQPVSTSRYIAMSYMSYVLFIICSVNLCVNISVFIECWCLVIASPFSLCATISYVNHASLTSFLVTNVDLLIILLWISPYTEQFMISFKLVHSH